MESLHYLNPHTYIVVVYLFPSIFELLRFVRSFYCVATNKLEFFRTPNNARCELKYKLDKLYLNQY